LVPKVLIISALICLFMPVRVQADNHEEFYNAALEYKKKGDYQNAIRLFKKSSRLKPNNPYAFHNLAHTYEAIGDFDQAIQAFDQAIVLDPNDAKHHYCKAGLYYDLARYEDAIREFKTAINLKPDYPSAYHNLGHSYEKIGDYERALFCLQKAIEIDPEEKDHRSCYDRVRQIKENIAKGIPQNLQEIPKHQERDSKIHEKELFTESDSQTSIINRVIGYLERNPYVRLVIIIAALLTIIMFVTMFVTMLVTRKGRA